MQNMKEALGARAELVMWKARKEAHRLRLDGLREKLLSELEDVERMETGGLFTRLKNIGRFESRLEKEEEEAAMAREELARIEILLKEADRRIDRLQKEVTASVWEELRESDFDEAEKVLLDWIKGMELAWKTAAENNACIESAREMLGRLREGVFDAENMNAFGERVNELYRLTGDFLRSMGAVSIIPGIKTRNWRRTYYVNGGKTVVFQQEGKPVREVKAHSFDYRNISSKVKAEEALIWAIMDLENNKLLFSELIEEKAESFLKIRNEG